MTLDEYYQKRILKSEQEGYDYAKSIVERFHRRPIPSDFKEEFIYFVSGDQINSYPEIPIKKQLGPIYNKYKENHKAKFHTFNDFLEAAGIPETISKLDNK